ncbi:uncharacterized protein HRG_10447 [Hirsutella rhossiliensis]|uniref:Uncharacterized protein n=1 Tax=Hirsutella rhossiliensis TaxID=111463 RepID=A0A9P8SEV0_9HYPO|nr:uncharacterized protein HRG_10447 [Hirsutella rhossiliensis]KAH0958760.1 hypothetical protein HRG_10447 [Hirsutella rhossiliensis]
MADSTTQASESHALKSAPKDKSCPYCRQAFTSSSLGRHLDLYIKDKNPKPPDGIHDVDAIRKLRGGITRRHPRGSLGRKASTPASTPRPSAKREASAAESESHKPASIPKDGQYAVDSTLSKFPFVPRWEATGVINDIPGRRTVSKQAAQKAQLDVKQKLADAMDTARAAELALRELLSSWRAAKQHIDNNSMPFDFDPLSLDFPALTLQCLRPPPTLFSSTQHPTSTSWSVQSPGRREYSALQAYFQEEFQSWKVACASATTAAFEELTYPPSGNPHRDAREAVKKAEKAAENLERQVEEHLQSAYAVWESLPTQRQQELWILELARGVGRKQNETVKLKEQRHGLEQENANLKSQIDQLNRLQQPREFKLLSPTTIPIDRDLISYAYEQGVKGGKSVGFDLEDRHVDLSTLVTKSIERWKDVITSTRATESGMGAQKPLDQAASTSGLPQTHQPPPKRLSTTSTNDPPSEQTASSVSNTGPPSIEETSDQDADAEMEDDDSFAIMNASPVKPAHPMQQQATLDVPRTRGLVQQQNAAQELRFMMPNGAGRSAMSMSRSMAGMNMAMQGNPLQGSDLGMMQPVRGDAMYME